MVHIHVIVKGHEALSAHSDKDVAQAELDRVVLELVKNGSIILSHKPGQYILNTNEVISIQSVEFHDTSKKPNAFHRFIMKHF